MRISARSRQTLRAVTLCVSACVLLLGGAPHSAGAQRPAIVLRIEPRVGDTLRMALDQEVEEVTATAEQGSADSVTVLTRMSVLGHVVVKRIEKKGAIIVMTTDSVAITTNGYNPDWVERARRELRGKQIRMRVSANGATEILDQPEKLGATARQLFSQMPAMLPMHPVAVGDTWTRGIGTPLATPGNKAGGSLTATFRLDSASQNGDLAYISMRAVLSRDDAPEASERMTQQMTGTVSGTMVIDRRRGWMTDSRTTMSVRSTVTPPAGVQAAPMRVRMRVTQWLRTVDK